MNSKGFYIDIFAVLLWAEWVQGYNHSFRKVSFYATLSLSAAVATVTSESLVSSTLRITSFLAGGLVRFGLVRLHRRRVADDLWGET